MWVIALTWHLYDWLSSLDLEVQYIWRGPYMKSKTLFLVNRYWGMMYLIQGNLVMALAPSSDSRGCKAWFNFYLWSIAPVHFTFGAIAYGRLHAAFNCNKVLSIVISLLLGSGFVVATVLLAITAAKDQVAVLPPGWTGCIPYHTISYGLVIWIPVSTSEGTLLVLLLVRMAQLLWRRATPPDLLYVILRDTAVYVVMSVVAVAATTSVQGVNATTFVALPPMLMVLLSVNGCRMLLNIHRRLNKTRVENMPGSLELCSFSVDYTTD